MTSRKPTPPKPPTPATFVPHDREQLNAHETGIRDLGARMSKMEQVLPALHRRLDEVTEKQQQDSGGFKLLGEQVTGISTQLGSVISDQANTRVLMEKQAEKISSLDATIGDFSDRMVKLAHDVSEVREMKPAIDMLVLDVASIKANYLTETQIKKLIGEGSDFEKAVKSYGGDIAKAVRKSTIFIIGGAIALWILGTLGISQYRDRFMLEHAVATGDKTLQTTTDTNQRVKEKLP